MSLDKRLPDAKWLIDILAILCPGDEIFGKGYLYTRPKE